MFYETLDNKAANALLGLKVSNVALLPSRLSDTKSTMADKNNGIQSACEFHEVV